LSIVWEMPRTRKRMGNLPIIVSCICISSAKLVAQSCDSKFCWTEKVECSTNRSVFPKCESPSVLFTESFFRRSLQVRFRGTVCTIGFRQSQNSKWQRMFRAGNSWLTTAIFPEWSIVMNNLVTSTIFIWDLIWFHFPAGRDLMEISRIMNLLRCVLSKYLLRLVDNYVFSIIS